MANKNISTAPMSKPQANPKSANPQHALTTIGWREWVALPGLAVPAIKAKVDTGARSSSLHAFDVQTFAKGGKLHVRFKVHPFQREAQTTIAAEAELLEFRQVRSSGGHQSLRPVIRTDIELLGQRWTIELTLAARDTMGFRMLLGREALRGRFLVHPGRSYFGGRPPRATRKRRNKRSKRQRPNKS